MQKLLVIGAGITGLQVARSLSEGKVGRVMVIEKSRGVGGRMATRRSESAKFDHGAQFYTIRRELAALDERWRKAGLVEEWMQRDGAIRMRAKQGMSSLAKNLAEGVDLDLEQKAVLLERVEGGWKIETEKGASYLAEEVLLTAPLPQALELLEASKINYRPDLKQIRYAKALVGLFERVQSGFPLANGFAEEPTPAIHSIADQAAKGMASAPSWVVVMSAEFSEREFENADEKILEKITSAVKELDRRFEFGSVQLKKWRYSHPLAAVEGGFFEAEKGLFLAGDAFGKPSIGGAVASANAFVNWYQGGRP